MSSKRDDIPNDLTPDEMRRLLATVQRRFKDHPDVLGVGLGSAIQDGEPDPARPLAIRLWIKKKRGKRSLTESRILRGEEPIRLKRGDGYLMFDLPVDVSETAPIRPSANIDPGDVTTSTLVRWNSDSLPEPAYGFLTCAHGFKQLNTCRNASRSRCAVAVKDGAGMSAASWLRWRSTMSQGVDAAICRCERDPLRQWLGTNLPTSQRDVVPIEDIPLLAALKTPGRTFSTPTGSPIRLLSYTPGPIDLDGTGILPPLRHVVEADAGAANTFKRGTSGSLWVTSSGSLAIQSAGLAPHFKRGYAVALRAALGRAFAALSANNLAVLDHPI